ncbi:hypothetical protein EVAR_13650_1 [Eumeta japonica]|uniref:Uncharacterized protein n=1 Tax=Eumeta variegata TaxID=151549 RepID=A0A4C1UUR6_EUMVA|nr:hypothetical protein EVAR_13650_1 [Eumeta japonica]
MYTAIPEFDPGADHKANSIRAKSLEIDEARLSLLVGWEHEIVFRGFDGRKTPLKHARTNPPPPMAPPTSRHEHFTGGALEVTHHAPAAHSRPPRCQSDRIHGDPLRDRRAQRVGGGGG